MKGSFRKNAVFSEDQSNISIPSSNSATPLNSGNNPEFPKFPNDNDSQMGTNFGDSTQQWFSTSQFQNTVMNGNNNNNNGNDNNNQFFNPTTELILGIGMEKLYGSGKEYIDSGLGRYFSFFNGLKKYFNVDNQYVLRKLSLLLFPFRHKTWERKEVDTFQPQIDAPDAEIDRKRDINDPDLYIPTMSFVTYVLLVGIITGASEEFTPDVLAKTATTAGIISFLEVGVIKLGFYLLSVPNNFAFLDITAYCTYKYVFVVLALLGAVFFGTYAYYPLILLFGLLTCYFMVKTLRRAGIYSSDQSMRIKLDENASRRNYFVIIIAVLQIPLLLLVTIFHAKQIIFNGEK